MIPMACPSCGRRGSIPHDKVNSRLHCKKCNAIFHMDAAGHVVMGEPGRAAKPGSTSGVFTVPGLDSGQYGKAPSGVHGAAKAGAGSGLHAAATATAPAATARTELPGVWESLPGVLKLALVGLLVLALLWALGVRPPFGA